MDKRASINETRSDIICKVANVLREERATATNIESAVDKAGINREAVATTFGSMHGLILEMVSDLSSAAIQPLEDHPDEQTVRDVLIEFGRRLVNIYCVSHLVALYRIALTEATRHSGIGREFFDRGPGRIAICLAQYLEYSSRRFDQWRMDNPRRVADSFLSLLGDQIELFDAITPARTLSASDQSNAVVDAVELVCRGIATEGQ
jgi:AcrR family transcriptional regulator